MRERIKAEAMTWIGTPWHHAARVKGAGVDCVNFLIAVYSRIGLMPNIKLAHYPHDWHMHRDEPKFLNGLAEHCDKVDDVMTGDIVMFKYGRHAAHGAIYIGDNKIVHAWQQEYCVCITNLATSPITERIHGYYRPKAMMQ